jgi:tetratricopeptide (TPR) repeat protein
LRVRTIETDPFGWAQVQQNLGNAHSILGETAKGVAKYDLALKVFTADFPVERRRTLKSIGQSWFGCGEFEKALGPFQAAIAIGEELLWDSSAPEAKQAEAAEISTLYPNVAYSLLALGRPEEALAMLQRGKTRLIAQALAISDPALRGLGSAERTRIQMLRDEIRGTEALLQQTMRRDRGGFAGSAGEVGGGAWMVAG